MNTVLTQNIEMAWANSVAPDQMPQHMDLGSKMGLFNLGPVW